MGVTAELPPELLAVQQEALKRGIKNTEGTEAFSLVLQSALPQILVSTRDFGFRLEQAIAVGRVSVEETQQSASAAVQRHSRPSISKEYVAPRNEIEQKIADIWGGLLGIDAVGVNDDFFELGGHSLLATQIVSRLRHELHVAVPMRRLFEVPTVAGLSLAVIEEQTSLASGESLAETVAAMEQLSEEEVEALLAAESRWPGQDVSDD
jgi:acyl carrier protein